MNKLKKIFPDDRLEIFEAYDRGVVNVLTKNGVQYCRFDLMEDLKVSKFLFKRYQTDIKPYLPWNAIEKTVSSLQLDDKEIDSLVFLMMPFPIEHMLRQYEKQIMLEVGEGGLNKTFEKLYGHSLTKASNTLIKRHSRLRGELERLRMFYDWREFEPLGEVIKKLDEGIAGLRNSIAKIEERERTYKKLYSFDKDLCKSPKKQNYWNLTILPALEVINNKSHTDGCARLCRKTHSTAYHVTAKLLKVLYPAIWTEPVTKIVNQIKSREQRAL